MESFPYLRSEERLLKRICSLLRCSQSLNLLYPPPCAFRDRVRLRATSSCIEGRSMMLQAISPQFLFSRLDPILCNLCLTTWQRGGFCQVYPIVSLQPSLLRSGLSHCDKQCRRGFCSTAGSDVAPPAGSDRGGSSFGLEPLLFQLLLSHSEEGQRFMPHIGPASSELKGKFKKFAAKFLSLTKGASSVERMAHSLCQE